MTSWRRPCSTFAEVETGSARAAGLNKLGWLFGQRVNEKCSIANDSVAEGRLTIFGVYGSSQVSGVYRCLPPEGFNVLSPIGTRRAGIPQALHAVLNDNGKKLARKGCLKDGWYS